jgi:transcriptional regulator with XRE-family HTH domain
VTDKFPDHHQVYVEIGRVLRAKRREGSVSQGEFARSLGMSATRLTYLERARYRISILDLIRICKKLNLSPGQVMEEAWERACSSRTDATKKENEK